METESVHELIRCAQNDTMTIRPESQRRERVVLALVREGYLIPKSKVDDTDFKPALLSSVHGQLLTLTKMGKAYVLALNPADFATVQFWPLPSDIEDAQYNIRHE